MTTEQITVFLERILEDRWYTALIVAMRTGLRRGELAALRWSNVDLQNGVIYVKEAVSRIDTFAESGPRTKLIFQSPKTKKGLRTIPLPAEVLTELKRWKAKQVQEKLMLQITGLYQDGCFVFTWPDGRMVDPGFLTKHFHILIRGSGLEGVHLHSLRHSYASMLLKAGEHPKVVQELLGHASISMTLDTYSHVAPELKEAAAAKLDGLLKTKKASSSREAFCSTVEYATK